MTKLKKTETFIIMALIVLVIPFFLLSIYCHPSVDDYIFSGFIKGTNISGFFDHMRQNWSGRYTGTFFTVLNPTVYNNLFIYKLIPAVLLLLFFCSVFSILKVIFYPIVSNTQTFLLSLILFAIYLNCMPDLAEGIYWYSSATFHFTGGIFSMFLISLIINIPKTKKIIPKVLEILVSIVLVILIAGSNEIHSILIFEFLVLVIIARLYFRKKINVIDIVLIVVLVVSSVFALNTPGNFKRLELFPNHYNFTYAFPHSFKSTVYLIGHHLQSAPFIIISIISIPIISKFLNNEKASKINIRINPIIAFLLSLLIIASLYFPPYLALGIDPPWRIHNSISLVFIFLWFLNIFIIIKYLYDKKYTIPPTPKYLTTLLIVIAFLFAFIDFHIKDPQDGIKFKGNIANAYYDLFFVAPKYDNEMRLRNSKIENDIKSGKTEIEIESLINIPQTIFYRDITDDSKNWMNVGVAIYYGVNSIKVKDDVKE